MKLKELKDKLALLTWNDDDDREVTVRILGNTVTVNAVNAVNDEIVLSLGIEK